MMRYSFALVGAVSFVACVSDASAQRVPHSARTPVVSPYMNLFRGNTGGSNSYFTFVRPLQTQMQYNQQQEWQHRLLMQQIQTNEPMWRDLSREISPSAGTGLPGQRPSNLGRPATAATYLDFSHFYQMPASGRTRQRSR